MSFHNKVVIVTGGSAGIGAVTAVEFTKEGADVVIIGRNEDNLAKVAQKCAKVGATPLVIKADISIEAEASTIVEQTILKYGKLDVLVNNAAIIDTETLLGGNILQSYDKIMNTNLRPVVHLTSLAAPHLIKTHGNIVNISSIAGSKAIATMLAYCVSKAGLDHFSRGAALELAASGVRVNIVSPGPVLTEILKSNEVHDTNLDEWTKKTALQKISNPEEVAEVIMFLASDKAKSITGANYVIDNGILLK